VGGLVVGLSLFSAVLIAALGSAVLMLATKERDVKIAEVMRENANLARAFEEHTVRTLAYVDEILLLATQRFESLGQQFDLARFFHDLQINPAVMQQAVITNTDGVVILSSHGALSMTRTDQESINVHQGQDTHRMFIGKPTRDPVHQRWSFLTSRQAKRPDGVLLGVVAIAINPFYFSNFYKELELGQHGTVALVGFDGVIRARLAHEGHGIGESLAQGMLFQHFPAAYRGAYIAPSPVDGIARIYAYRALRDYPLIVQVGVDRQEALSEVAQRVRGYYVALCLAALLILVGAGALMMLARRHQGAALALAQNEQLLHAIIGHSSTPIAVRDLQEHVVLANTAWMRTWETPVGMAIQPPVGAQQEGVAPVAWESEEVVPTPSGVRTLLTTQFPLQDADGQVFALGSISTDISQRKQAEDDIRQMNHELQQQATELAAVNRELEAFAYSVSHDLRAPLRAISGYGQLLVEEYSASLQGEGKRYLGIVQSEARRMGVLINEMLKLSRVTRAPLEYRPVNLSTLVERHLTLLRQHEPTRVVEAHIAPDIVVEGDQGLLDIALENLVENAWKFTVAKPVACIAFGMVTQNGERVCFLRDNGVGFDPVYTNKLFVAFHRLHGAEYEGAGVGLATVSRVIQRHRGRIWVESALGQGTTFYFVLGAS
jgi:signal transduction histidine kinase